MRRSVTKTIQTKEIIELTADDIEGVIREKLGLSPLAHVEFNVSESNLRGASIVQVTTEAVKP